MGFFSWIFLGLFAGFIAKVIAKRFMPGQAPDGCIATGVVGIAGGVLGGVVSSALFDIDMGGFFDLRSWVISIIGAFALLGIYQWWMTKKTPEKLGD